MGEQRVWAHNCVSCDCGGGSHKKIKSSKGDGMESRRMPDRSADPIV